MQYSTQAIIYVLEALGERKGGGRGNQGGECGGKITANALSPLQGEGVWSLYENRGIEDIR